MLVQFEIKSLKDETRLAGLVLPAGRTVVVDLDEEVVLDLQKKVDAGEIAVKGMKPKK